MTDRVLTPAVKTETTAASVVTVAFVELAFDGGVVRVWSGIGPVVATMPGGASQTWTGIGNLGSIDAIAESDDRRENGVKLTLSGVDNSLFNDVLNETYQGRAVKIWVAFLNSNHVVMADPVVMFSGIMDTMSVADGDPEGTIVLQCESRQVLLQRTSTSLLTDQQQQRLFPGDLGLAFVQELQSKEIIWGSPTPGSDKAGPVRGAAGNIPVQSGRFQSLF